MSKHRGKQQRFVQLHHWLLRTAAWKDLGAVERSIYVELLFRYNGQNNGRIGYSARTAAQDLKIGKGTAAKRRCAAFRRTDSSSLRNAARFTARFATPANIG
jgi:hypothetical protein